MTPNGSDIDDASGGAISSAIKVGDIKGKILFVPGWKAWRRNSLRQRPQEIQIVELISPLELGIADWFMSEVYLGNPNLKKANTPI